MQAIALLAIRRMQNVEWLGWVALARISSRDRENILHLRRKSFESEAGWRDR
jgi:hypothetical protein